MEIEITKQANLIFGESYIFWIPTGAVILSAIAAVYVIYLNGKRERRRTTIDLVIATEQDKVYKEK
jgi:anti-sigma-K factor RskA